MTRVTDQEKRKKCFNTTESEQFILKGLNKTTEKTMYQYVHHGFSSSPEVSSERRMWDLPMTRGHKSQKQYTLVKPCFH